jgi:hypothetical protein
MTPNAVLLVTLLLASGCGPPRGGPATAPSAMNSADGRFTVSITTANRLVLYVVKDATGKERAAGNGGSDNARWFARWDGSNRLWFYSGDIGTFVLIPAGERFESHSLAEKKELIQTMPDDFKAMLPQSSKTALGISG